MLNHVPPEVAGLFGEHQSAEAHAVGVVCISDDPGMKTGTWPLGTVSLLAGGAH